MSDALDRIKARAVARGDHVNENSDVLYVNDIAVYSLCNGYIRNNVNFVMIYMRVCRKQALSRVKYYYQQTAKYSKQQ